LLLTRLYNRIIPQRFMEVNSRLYQMDMNFAELCVFSSMPHKHIDNRQRMM